MAEVSRPDPAYLRERLRYEPETGRLYWRDHPALPNHWNARYAGTEALATSDGQGYRHGSIDGRRTRAHRVIWAMVHDTWPDEIDHEDHDRSNNRIVNLRDRDKRANLLNQTRPRNNTSGVIGVDWHTRAGKWRARIRIDNRAVYLGSFDTLEEAARRRKDAERQHGFHANHGAAK